MMEEYWFKHIIYCLDCDRRRYCTVKDLEACIKMAKESEKD